MTTFKYVFAYFWHEILAAKRTHPIVEIPGTARICPNMAQSSQFHVGMCKFGSEIIVPKVVMHVIFYEPLYTNQC
jgi:hypothetical protein